jgi:hypothetical protein
MVKQFWQRIPADLRARRPTAKIAKNNSEQRTNLLLKYLSAHLHTTLYLARFLAKIRNRPKRTALHASATVKTATSADCGGKYSMPLLHPCIFEDGLGFRV